MNTTYIMMLRWIQLKTRKYHMSNVISSGTHQHNNYFPHEEYIVMVRSCAVEKCYNNVAKSMLNTQIERSRPIADVNRPPKRRHQLSKTRYIYVQGAWGSDRSKLSKTSTLNDGKVRHENGWQQKSHFESVDSIGCMAKDI